MNFEEVREYQPGDEIRAIDWNVTARLGTAFVKKFTEERELTVMLVVDVSASGNFGSVIAVEARTGGRSRLSARLQRHSQQRQSRPAPLHRSRGTFHSAKEGPLAYAAHHSRDSVFRAGRAKARSRRSRCDYLNKVVTRRAVVFFVSDFQTGDFSRELAVSGRRHDFIAIHVAGRTRTKFCQTSESSRWKTPKRASKSKSTRAIASTRARFTELAEAQQEELARTLRRNSIDTISLRTGDDYLPALRSFFKQRERRLAVR